jgi:hypothetical protein
MLDWALAGLTGILRRGLFTPFERRRARLRHDHAAAQDEVARRLVDRFGSTRHGKKIGLHRVKAARDFKTLPLSSIDDHIPFERPLYYSETTGTTGAMKEIPVTPELLKANLSGFQLMLAGAIFDEGQLGWLAGDILFLGACKPLRKGDDGVWRGPGTTIAVKERPLWARRKTIPANELDELPDWGAKIDTLITIIQQRDVRIAAGLPPWLLTLCERATDLFGPGAIRKLMPNLGLTFHSGTTLPPYQARLDQHLAPTLYRDLYSASEGFLGLQDSPQPGLLPLADQVVFEFIPIDELESPSPRRFLLGEVELGVEYALICSTFAGLFCNVLGDTVRFISRDPPRFAVVGRTTKRVSVTNERVTFEQVEQAAMSAARAEGLDLLEASVWARPPGAHGAATHVWFIELASERGAPPDLPARLAEHVDGYLKKANYYYARVRQGERPPLETPRVVVLPAGSYARWSRESGRIGGHHKMPRMWEQAPAEWQTLDPACPRVEDR